MTIRPDAPVATERLRVVVGGTVQGVGFRPFVFRLAEELGLSGFVRNDERGVLLEAEGGGAALGDLLRRLPAEAPPLAVVADIESAEISPRGDTAFRIRASAGAGEPSAGVTPDAAACADCLTEMNDPGDRRHRYPFINCTNCGPRFTIVRGIPYDRRLTTMASFEMCAECRAEYEDPRDRRFHAQPNACPKCGPAVRLVDRAGRPVAPEPGIDAVAAAAEELRRGRILAVKGIGGFHLACLAGDEGAVAELRKRKHREDKPFALMAADLEQARLLVDLTPAEAALLEARERPILIAHRRTKRPPADVASSVAPGRSELGVMLPYTPLHHLLLAGTETPLVMTSANLSDEPIAFRDEDALRRLAGIADLFLLHDRPIQTRTDDSVLRALDPQLRRRPLLVRRSRGFVPESLTLPVAAPAPVLACGAELKSTFCVGRGRAAWVSHHIGDLKNYETLISFRSGIEHFCRLFEVEPEIVAHDLHPDYLSTSYATELEGVRHVAVQHHHAHLAACLAEHGVTGPAVGAIFDGSGLGPDGTVWGGEILRGDLRSFERAGMLSAVRLPGGDAAVREPWRMACSWLAAAYDEERPALPAHLGEEVAADSWAEVCGLVSKGLASPLTTSAGRLFDAAAALCGVRMRVNYEGQAAIEFEAIADHTERAAYPLPVGDGDVATLDARPAIRALVDDIERSVPVDRVSARLHNAVARATALALTQEAERIGTEVAVLSGGVFQNRLLIERTALALTDAGLRPLLPERLPPNDGGIAYGQAAIAAAVLAAPEGAQ